MSSSTSGRRGRHRRRGRPGRAAEAAVPLAVGGTVAAVALLGPLTSDSLRDGARHPGSSAGADRHGSDDPSRTTLLSFPGSDQPDAEDSPVPTAAPGRSGGGTSTGSTAGAASRSTAEGGSTAASTGGSGGSAAHPTSAPTGDPSTAPTSDLAPEPSDPSPEPSGDPTTEPPDRPTPPIPLPSLTITLPGL